MFVAMLTSPDALQATMVVTINDVLKPVFLAVAQIYCKYPAHTVHDGGVGMLEGP